MVPAVLDEAKVSPFKFWFNNQIQLGMSYQNELFYCLFTVDVSERAYLYQYACHISQGERLVLTTSQTTCSLWVSLRNAMAVTLRVKSNPIPGELKPPSTAS